MICCGMNDQYPLVILFPPCVPTQRRFGLPFAVMSALCLSFTMSAVMHAQRSLAYFLLGAHRAITAQHTGAITPATQAMRNFFSSPLFDREVFARVAECMVGYRLQVAVLITSDALHIAHLAAAGDIRVPNASHLWLPCRRGTLITPSTSRWIAPRA